MTLTITISHCEMNIETKCKIVFVFQKLFQKQYQLTKKTTLGHAQSKVQKVLEWKW